MNGVAVKARSEIRRLRRLIGAKCGFHAWKTSDLSPAVSPLVEISPNRHAVSPHARLCAITDKGIVRDSNEDAFRITAEDRAFLVADGMGGEQSGEIASAIAAEVFRELGTDFTCAPDFLRQVFSRAQRLVLERSMIDPTCAGMGTAVVATALDDDLLSICHLGDSRAYLLRQDTLRRLTTDHSTVARLVLRGDLSWEDARLHPNKSALYKAIGFEGVGEPDFTSVRLAPGDRLLLCSDGLWDELSDHEIQEVLTSDGTVWELAHLMLNRALAAGGHDNVTLILYEHSCAEEVSSMVSTEKSP
jgi:PPM family protein phosphatase